MGPKPIVGRTGAAARGAPTVRQGSASVESPGVTNIFFNRCVSLLRDMPRVVSHSCASRLEFMGRVKQSSIQYFRAGGSRPECMQAIETALDVPCVKEARIRFWLGRRKGSPRVAQLAAIAEHGAPVHVEGSTDIGAALEYSNHRSVAPHSDTVLAKIFRDVRFGRSLIFRAEKRTPSPIWGCLRWPWWCLRPKLGLSTI